MEIMKTMFFVFLAKSGGCLYKIRNLYSPDNIHTMIVNLGQNFFIS